MTFIGGRDCARVSSGQPPKPISVEAPKLTHRTNSDAYEYEWASLIPKREYFFLPENKPFRLTVTLWAHLLWPFMLKDLNP